MEKLKEFQIHLRNLLTNEQYTTAVNLVYHRYYKGVDQDFANCKFADEIVEYLCYNEAINFNNWSIFLQMLSDRILENEYRSIEEYTKNATAENIELDMLIEGKSKDEIQEMFEEKLDELDELLDRENDEEEETFFSEQRFAIIQICNEALTTGILKDIN